MIKVMQDRKFLAHFQANAPADGIQRVLATALSLRESETTTVVLGVTLTTVTLEIQNLAVRTTVWREGDTGRMVMTAGVVEVGKISLIPGVYCTKRKALALQRGIIQRKSRPDTISGIK